MLDTWASSPAIFYTASSSPDLRAIFRAAATRMSFGAKLLSEIARPDVERFIEDLLPNRQQIVTVTVSRRCLSGRSAATCP